MRLRERELSESVENVLFLLKVRFFTFNKPVYLHVNLDLTKAKRFKSVIGPMNFVLNT